jgi:hypothetical protein
MSNQHTVEKENKQASWKLLQKHISVQHMHIIRRDRSPSGIVFMENSIAVPFTFTQWNITNVTLLSGVHAQAWFCLDVIQCTDNTSLQSASLGGDQNVSLIVILMVHSRGQKWMQWSTMF